MRIAGLRTPFLRLGGALPSVQNGGRRVAGRSDHDTLRGSPLASRPQEERGGQARAEQHYLFGKSAYKRPREERKQKAPRSCSAAMGAPGAGTPLRTCCHLHLAQVPHFWTNPPDADTAHGPSRSRRKAPRSVSGTGAAAPARAGRLPTAGVAHFLAAPAPPARGLPARIPPPFSNSSGKPEARRRRLSPGGGPGALPEFFPHRGSVTSRPRDADCHREEPARGGGAQEGRSARGGGGGGGGPRDASPRDGG